jgi:phosphoglycolate phosphatase
MISKSMKIVKYVVFDFDGTIADTLDLALKIYNRIAPEYNCKLIEQKVAGLLRTEKPQRLLKLYGVSNLKLLLLILRIRKEMSKHITEIEPVKDIKDSLHELKNAGFNLGILTSNSIDNVRKFLENNALSGVFDFIYSGKSLFGKDKLIMRMLNNENISRESVIYVGDETRDVEAAKKAGIPVIAVCWGLNTKELLNSVNPDQITGEPEELFSCVQQIS